MCFKTNKYFYKSDKIVVKRFTVVKFKVRRCVVMLKLF